MDPIRDHYPSSYDNPFNGLDRLLHVSMSWAGEESSPHADEVVAPKTDVFVDAGHYYLRVELPGVEKHAIELSRQDRGLILEAATEATDAFADEKIRYYREFRIPDDVDVSAISAHLGHGILQITLPKASAKYTRRFKID